MEFYKTFHRLCVCFIFPGMRNFTTQSIKSCAHCILANLTVRDASELMYSTPTAKPFSVIHANLWSPGSVQSHFTNSYILICIDELTGFVYVVLVPDTSSSTIAKHFMEFLLRFGLCSLVIVDADNCFLGNFRQMCAALNLTLAPLAKFNHTAMRVERFNRFLNKVVSIATSDCGSPTVLEEAAFVASYAWNSAPIDGTDIVCSFPAIGCILCFLIDCDPSHVLHVDDPSFAVTQFLALSQSTQSIATSILSFLLDDRCTAHCKRVNATPTTSSFRVNDIVTARVQQQSNSSLSRVQKLLYKAKGPFRIIKNCNLAPSKFTTLTSPLACGLNFKPTICSSCPAWCSPFDRLIKLTFAI